MNWRQRPSRKPSPEYSRTFSALFFGLSLIVTGAIGYNVKNMSGAFRGGHWQDGPVWWQLAIGLGLFALGVYWFRRLPGGGWTFVTGRARPIKNVGHGRTADVEHATQPRLPGADRM